MSADTETDFNLKFGLLNDALSLVDCEGRFNGNLPDRLGGFDLIVSDNIEVRKGVHGLPTLLGCNNKDRNEVNTVLFAKAEASRVQ